MPITAQELETVLSEYFPGARVEIQDLAGDNDHYAIAVTSAAFAGKSRIEQHKLVQDAVKDKNIHALSIKTKIPE